MYAEGGESVLGKLLKRISSPRKLINVVGFLLRWRSVESLKANGRALTLEEKERAQILWLKYVQFPMLPDLEKWVKCQDWVKVSCPYKNLALFLNSDNVWKVGSRS